MAGVANQPNDTFLLRRDLVALLNESVPGGGFDRVERVNYDQNINARLIVNGLGGDDKIVADDNSSITTLDGGDGNDTFQIGQVFGTLRDADAGLDPGDTFDTTPIIIGLILDPVTSAVIFDPTTFDPTTDVLPPETIVAINAAIAFQAGLGEALDGIAYVSDGVRHATTVFGGDGKDLFNVYHNKGTLRLEGEAGNDEFIVRAFVTVDLSVQADTEINGGGGADTINYAINAPVSIDGGAGFDLVVVLGTPFNDSFVVTSDGIFGAGLNVIFNNVESAELDTLEGDDTIYVLGTSADIVTTVIGGLGNDTIEVLGDVINTIISNDLLGRSGVITHGLDSNDPGFDNVGVNGVAVNVLSAGSDSPVNIEPTGEPLLVTEDGTLASYFINLVDPDPAALLANPVYLTVSAGIASSEDRGTGGAGILISVGGGAFTNAVVLTFDDTTAGTVFEIEVMAVDDLSAEGPRVALISHSINSDDPAFDDLALIDIFVDVVDNDKPGLDIRHLGDGSDFGDNETAVLEGASGFSDTYSVGLTRAPAAGETVTVTLNTDGQITALSLAGAAFLEFDASNWMTPQIVVVTAVEDGQDGIEISTITHAIAGGTVYGAIPPAEVPELDVTVYDDETPGAIVQETAGSTIVVEGGSADTYRVRLTSMPDGDVTLTLRTDTQTLLSTSGGFATTDESGVLGFFEYTYTFTTDNWHEWVEIEVSADPAFVGTDDTTKTFPPVDQNLDRINGPLIIEGGIGPGEPRALAEPVLLPNETNDVSEQIGGSTDESADIDTLNVFHSDNNDSDNGSLFYRTVDGSGRTIANPGLALTGFEMGDDLSAEEGTPESPLTVHYGGGITLNGVEIVEILLGKGDETLDIADTGDRDEKDPAVVDDPATITAVHGGGGSDTIRISGRGNGPLVVYGDTSEDRARYGNDAPVASIHGTSFANDGDDIIDARLMADQNEGFVGLVAYGGFGNDTIRGSQDDDHLAGGTSSDGSRDFIDGQAGNDHIYGDSHFNVNLSLFAEDQREEFDISDPRVAEMFTVLVETPGDDSDLGSDQFRESAGVDEVWGGNGSDIIFGDHGVISLAEGTRRLTTTGSVERIDTVQPAFGGDDTLYGHSDDPTGPEDDSAGDRIFGGQGGDFIDAGDGNNVVLGDEGFVDLGEADSAIDRIESTSTTFEGGADTIFTGSDNDIVIGGRFGDTITVADGTNIVLGDAGFVQYQNGGPLVGEVSSVYLDENGKFIPAGDDTITVGVGANTGNDIVIGSLGDDTITIGDGDNIVLGDDGSVTFQAGSTLRKRVESRYLDNFGDSPTTAPEAAVGNDTVITGIGNDIVIGGLGVDGITIADGDNILLADEGLVVFEPGTGAVDRIQTLNSSEGGNDNVTTGDGADIILGGFGEDTLTGGDGTAVVLGDNGSIEYTLDGDSSDIDRIVTVDPSEGGNDRITSGNGDDLLVGGTGSDTIFGGDGSDVILGDFAEITGDILFHQSFPPANDPNFVYTSIDTNHPSGNADTIHAGAGDDFVLGQQGGDTIFGEAGEDDITGGHNVLFGSDGNDTIDGGSQADVILGDNGVITRHLVLPERVWERYPEPYPDVIREIVRFDDIDLVRGDDLILGRAGQDIIHGQRGDDEIRGGADDDELMGELGADKLFGDDGHDFIAGDVGLFVRAFNQDGSIRLNANGAWHRDLVTEEVGVLTRLLDISATPNADLTGDIWELLLNADLILPMGVHDADGNRVPSVHADSWRTMLALIDLLPGDNDRLEGGSGEDFMIGQRGDDVLSGGDDGDLLIGDLGWNRVSFESDLPFIISGLRLLDAQSGLGLQIQITAGGKVIMLDRVIQPGELEDFMARWMETTPAVESLVDAFSSDGNRLVLSDGNFLKPGLAFAPTVGPPADALSGNDELNGDNGDDLVVGDNLTVVSQNIPDYSRIDTAIDDVWEGILGLQVAFEHLRIDAELLDRVRNSGEAGAEIVVAADRITGGDGEDLLIGDNALVLAPAVDQGEFDEGTRQDVVLEFYDRVRSLEWLLRDAQFFAEHAYSRLLNALVDEAIEDNPSRTKPKKADLIDVELTPVAARGDEIEGDGGADLIIGDDGLVLVPVTSHVGTRNDAEDRLDVSRRINNDINRALRDEDRVRDRALSRHVGRDHDDPENAAPTRKGSESPPVETERAGKDRQRSAGWRCGRRLDRGRPGSRHLAERVGLADEEQRGPGPG